MSRKDTLQFNISHKGGMQFVFEFRAFFKESFFVLMINPFFLPLSWPEKVH